MPSDGALGGFRGTTPQERALAVVAQIVEHHHQVQVGVGVGGALSDRAVQQHKARIEMRERVRGALRVGQRGSGTRHAFQGTSGIDDHGHRVER